MLKNRREKSTLLRILFCIYIQIIGISQNSSNFQTAQYAAHNHEKTHTIIFFPCLNLPSCLPGLVLPAPAPPARGLASAPPARRHAPAAPARSPAPTPFQGELGLLGVLGVCACQGQRVLEDSGIL